MRKVHEIIKDKNLTINEKNAELEKIGSNVRLAEGKNVITAEEEKKTVVDTARGVYKGFGLLDHGIGGMDKVEVINGKLKYNIGNIQAYLYMGDHEFEIVDGEKLKLID